MSGALSKSESEAGGDESASTQAVELSDARIEAIGTLQVARSLPQRRRRAIGAWCFVDHFGPATVVKGQDPQLGPHPHMGLHTVTWLLEGEALHNDSLGSEQSIRPGQLNIMTSGHGIAHAEDMLWQASERRLHGVQLWIAQPHATRNAAAAFAHHESVPQTELPNASVSLLIGELCGLESTARLDSALVGADLSLRGSAEMALDPSFEHGVLVLDGNATVNGTQATTNQMVYLPTSTTQLVVSPVHGQLARLLLIGGVPFGEKLFMWWNFVGRSRDEIDDAQRAWNADDGRFGTVRSSQARIAAPNPHWR